MKVLEEAYNVFDQTSVDEFWRFIDSQNWQLDSDCSIYRAHLMKTISPATAGKYKRILEHYACILGSRLSDKFIFRNAIDTKIMAANAIGQGGKGEFVKLFNDPNSGTLYEDSLDLCDCFLSAIPTEDDYWF